MYIRISRGKFDPALAGEVEALLRESEKSLAAAIKKLPGVHSYRTGTDPVNGYMIGMSRCDSPELGATIGKLPEMIAS